MENQDWATGPPGRRGPWAAGLPLAKPFDGVPHDRLLLTLNRYGQVHCGLGTLQRVLIRGSYSEWSPVTSGVHQGSILGPIMFLIYVNDMPTIITSTAKLFADDSKIYRQINSGRRFYCFTIRSNHPRSMGGSLAGEI